MTEATTTQRRFETFSFLPLMTEEEIRKQIDYILAQSLAPAIEYTAEPSARNVFWSMWRLPLFDSPTAEQVLAEIEACATENPGAYVKLNGYDPKRQGQSASFVVRYPS